MTNQEIKQILMSKGVTELYHANSVETSLTFLKNNGLISRGVCEDKNFPQSSQDSDNTDKNFGIYYDIFFDSVDVHERSSNANFYGPVLFVYSINVLDTVEEGSIKITKSNPKSWDDNITENDKYFTDIDDLRMGFRKGNFGQHITIVNRLTPLPFDHLKRIILNFPENNNKPIFRQAYTSIKNEAKNIKLILTVCNSVCKCNRFYAINSNQNKLFGLGKHST